jgi:putative oxidoreductase
MQMIMFMKNVALAGGLLLLTAHGAGRFSLDHYLARNRGQANQQVGATV